MQTIPLQHVAHLWKEPSVPEQACIVVASHEKHLVLRKACDLLDVVEDLFHKAIPLHIELDAAEVLSLRVFVKIGMHLEDTNQDYDI